MSCWPCLLKRCCCVGSNSLRASRGAIGEEPVYGAFYIAEASALFEGVLDCRASETKPCWVPQSCTVALLLQGCSSSVRTATSVFRSSVLLGQTKADWNCSSPSTCKAASHTFEKVISFNTIRHGILI